MLPMLALQSNPNAGSLVKSQRRLSGQIPMLALRSNPNAGSPVKSQCWLSGQIPAPALWSKCSTDHLIVDHHTSKYIYYFEIYL